MPVTNYHTIGGQILGEQTGGVVTEYMHDALGSVTGTTDGSGNLQNTYRWAGYGTLISKTGTAADPKFLWNGTLGYRQTGRPHAGLYVRRRHYAREQVGWTSIDPLFPSEAAYAYARRAPTIQTDPAGLGANYRQYVLALREDVSFSAGDSCGNGCSVEWKFILAYTGDAPSGWLIQKVTNKYDITCCGSTTSGVPPSGCKGYLSSYFEAWEVVNGIVMNPAFDSSGNCAVPLSWVPPSTPNPVCNGCNDVWSFASHNNCTHGTQLKTGELMFLPGNTDNPPSGFSVDPASCAGCLPWSSSYSGFDPEGGVGTTTLVSEWSCCFGPSLHCACPKDPKGCMAEAACST